MNETKWTPWTPGPWHYNEVFEAMHEGVERCFIGIGGNGSHVGYASVTGCVNLQEAQANARLISKAPEMAEALKALVQAWDNDPDGRLGVAIVNDARQLLNSIQNGGDK